ncbi:MAG: hypothetical protein ACK5LV_04145 [Lachnospirales bacterium]
MEVWDGFLEHADMEIGPLIDGLKERGEYENSIIVLTFELFAIVQDHGSLVLDDYYEDDFDYPKFVNLRIELFDDLLINNGSKE